MAEDRDPRRTDKSLWQSVLCARCKKFMWAEFHGEPVYCFVCLTAMEKESEYVQKGQTAPTSEQPSGQGAPPSPAAQILGQRMNLQELTLFLAEMASAYRQQGAAGSLRYTYQHHFQVLDMASMVGQGVIYQGRQVVPSEVVERVVALCLAHPTWGVPRLGDLLKEEGAPVKTSTVQLILRRYGLDSRQGRWLRLERQAADRVIQLTEEQVAFVVQQNPAFRERHIRSERPGALLNQDTFLVGILPGLGKVYVHAVVDTYSSYAFALLHPSKQTEAAVAVLHNGALPFFHERGLPVKAVLSSNGPEFWGNEGLPYRLYLSFVGVAQRTPQAQLPGANGFIARFYRTVLSEFFQQALRQTFYTSLDGLQEDLDRWLEHYNTVRVLEGFPNLGAPPSQRMMEYLEGAQHGGGSHAPSHGALLSQPPRQDAQAA